MRARFYVYSQTGHDALVSVVWCSTMTSNGNGITPPVSQREVWATSAAIIVGQLLFVVLTGGQLCSHVKHPPMHASSGCWGAALAIDLPHNQGYVYVAMLAQVS